MDFGAVASHPEGSKLRSMKRVLIFFLLLTTYAVAEWPYPESQSCPQDGNTAFSDGPCAHGSAGAVCPYSHLTGEVDKTGKPVRHSFTVKFDGR
jgi:hypothetical protein